MLTCPYCPNPVDPQDPASLFTSPAGVDLFVCRDCYPHLLEAAATTREAQRSLRAIRDAINLAFPRYRKSKRRRG